MVKRPIKFRVWDSIYKKFYTNRDVSIWLDGLIVGHGYTPSLKETKFIQQFTGLSDKNGKEIYEGDILKVPHGNVAVFWDEIWYSMFFRENVRDGILNVPVSLQSEVIGNIFENQDLIK